ncbi:MAG: MFS transporter [Oscillospiraceae bacterium]|jgi:Na+/melibiose symporter-like transporter|nr:MFS transporter [Oscillospiraceae bacterium]
MMSESDEQSTREQKINLSELRNRGKEILQNPVAWLRGHGLPHGIISPGELLLYFFSTVFGMISGGFTGKQDLVFKESFGISPNKLTFPSIICSVWDGLNDPFIGTWMDARRLQVSTLRWIMRISAITGSIFAVFVIWDGGFSATQHIIILILVNCLQDIVGTMSGVAGTKYGAGTSPFTQQRARIQVWQGVANTMFWFIANQLPQLMYSSDRFTVYQVAFFGALTSLPLAVTSGILPTFVKQRVDFNAVYEAENTEIGLDKKLNMKESFAVLKHNQLFLTGAVASFITVFTPTTGDEGVMWAAIGPKRDISGILAKVLGTNQATGIHFLMLKQTIAGTLASVLKPFNRQIVNAMGGPLKTLRLCSLIQCAMKFVMAFIGPKSIPRILLFCLFDMVYNLFTDVSGLAGGMIGYEYYDKVELETGLRSEGVTTAINALLGKFVTNNIGTLTGNAYLTWTGYEGGIIDGSKPVPERYGRTIWYMSMLTASFDCLVWWAARMFLHWTPEDRDRTEAALEERRLLAASENPNE